jgi:cbb3-type cytochrome oxidase maturation protein
MNALSILVPLTLAMGAAGLAAFMWSMRSQQYEDLDGAAERILIDEDEDAVSHGSKPIRTSGVGVARSKE